MKEYRPDTNDTITNKAYCEYPWVVMPKDMCCALIRKPDIYAVCHDVHNLSDIYHDIEGLAKCCADNSDKLDAGEADLGS